MRRRAISGAREIVVIGSQALLGSFLDAAQELLVSQEADMYPLDRPERADLIDGSRGELSPFHEEFGTFMEKNTGIIRRSNRVPGERNAFL